jgi:hypothetical protein
MVLAGSDHSTCYRLRVELCATCTGRVVYLGRDVKLGLVETGSRRAPSRLPSPRRKLEKSQGLVYRATLIIL